MVITTDEDYNKMLHLLGLIRKGKVKQAMTEIKKNKLQGMVSNALKHYIVVPNPKERLNKPFDDSIYKEFISEYLKRTYLHTYSTSNQKNISALTEISKMLGNFDEPYWRNESHRLMQAFVQDFFRRDRIKKLNKDNNLRLFCFRSIRPYLLSELAEDSIRVSSPVTFNDPFDCLIIASIRDRKSEWEKETKYGVHAYVEELQKIRVCCFAGWDSRNRTETYLNTLMWAHYAESHHGICVEYAVENGSPLLGKGIVTDDTLGRLDKVLYKTTPINYDEEYLSYKDCFLVKDKSWSYENEYRMVYYDKNRKEDYYVVPLSQLGLRITRIYFGINCSSSNKNLVKELMKGKNVNFVELESDKKFMNRIKVKE